LHAQSQLPGVFRAAQPVHVSPEQIFIEILAAQRAGVRISIPRTIVLLRNKLSNPRSKPLDGVLIWKAFRC